MSRSSVTCSAGQPARELRHRLVEAVLLLAPAGAVPDLDRVEVPDQHDLAREAGLVDQGLRKHDPPGRIELGVEGASRVAALKVAIVLVPKGAEPPHLLGEPVPRRCRPDRDAGLLLLGENDSLGQLRPELRRDRQPVLRVQRVLVLPEKRQATVSLETSTPALRESLPGLGWRSGRSPAIPVRSELSPTLTHFVPQCNTRLAG